MNLKFLSFLFIVSTVNCYDIYYSDKPYLEFIKSDQNFRNYFHPFFNSSIAYLKHLSDNAEINSKCRSSLKRWVKGIESYEPWALRVLESTGKSINSRLNGDIVNFGSFEYCQKFRSDSKKDIDFDGKYCVVSVQNQETEALKNSKEYQEYYPDLSERSRFLIEFNIGNAHGVCIPSTCSINEITSATNKLVKKYGFSVMPPKSCTTVSEPEKVTNLQIISFIILLTFLLLGIASTFTKNKFISNFSIAESYTFIHARSPNDNSKVFMHFMKFLMIIISISVHVTSFLAFYFTQPVGTIKNLEFPELIEHMFKRIYIVGTGMYFMGGFFVMFSFYDAIKYDKMKYNFFNFFITKYMKIVCISIAYILLTFLLPHLGSGPMYSDITNHLYGNCKENYWRIFLLISNEQPFMDQCSISTWYQSAEFQIYIINFFVIYYLIKKPKLGFALAIGQMVAITAFALYYTQAFNVPVIMNMVNFYVYDFRGFENIYLHFFYHYNSYNIGMFTALLIKNKVKFGILKYKTLNVLITAFMFASMYAFIHFLDYLEAADKSDHKYIRFFLPAIDKLMIVVPAFWFFILALGDSGSTKASADKSKNVSQPMPDKSTQKSLKPSALSILIDQLAKIVVSWSKLGFSLVAFQFMYVAYVLATLRTPVSLTPMYMFKELFSSYTFVFALSNIVFIFIENPLHKLNKSYLGLVKDSNIKDVEEINNNLVDKKSN